MSHCQHCKGAMFETLDDGVVIHVCILCGRDDQVRVSPEEAVILKRQEMANAGVRYGKKGRL